MQRRDIRADWATTAYAQHLAAVNLEHRIRASADMYGDDGELIVRKGDPIDYEAAKKIVRHKLTMPLDKSIELEGIISGTGLQRRFHEARNRYSDVASAHENLDFGTVFDRISVRMQLPPLVAQKLTIMAARQPMMMDQTVLGAWLAGLIGRELGLEEKELAILYVAAVSRDVGMLHVDPALLRSSGGLYGPEEWKALQSHAVVSRMILEECEGIPERLLDAVVQHHENVDGTGYPTGLKGSKLNILGQILSVADTVIALRVRRFRGSGRNLRDAQVVLQIEVDTYKEEVVQAATRVLGMSGISRTKFHSYDNRSALAEGLYRRALALQQCGGVLEEMVSLVHQESKRRNSTAVIRTYAQRLASTLARSGLGDGDIIEWLEEVRSRNDDVALVDLTEIDLQQRELLWQFKRLYVNIQTLSDDEDESRHSATNEILVRMRNFLDALEEQLNG